MQAPNVHAKAKIMHGSLRRAKKLSYTIQKKKPEKAKYKNTAWNRKMP